MNKFNSLLLSIFLHFSNDKFIFDGNFSKSLIISSLKSKSSYFLSTSNKSLSSLLFNSFLIFVNIFCIFIFNSSLFIFIFSNISFILLIDSTKFFDRSSKYLIFSFNLPIFSFLMSSKR